MNSDFTQKNKLEILGKLTASLAHEMRNPLSAIKLNLAFMKMSSDELPKEVNDSLDDCIQSSDMIESLIESILSFSRKKKEETTQISLNAVTNRAIDLTLPKAHKRRIIIEKDYSDDLPNIDFNHGHLLQVFLNLLGNAVEACEDLTGHIVIRTYVDSDAEDEAIIWKITDNGVGIEEDHKDKIFGEFFTNKETGTGLGLTVTKSIVEEYDAHLSFASKFGEGTTFEVRFKNNNRGDDAE